ncbi:MAG TPA: amidase [Candidatus Sulfotelmatobacter sp.]|nr:amidase [Candidatus Sulfotelmatobacter sp.]
MTVRARAETLLAEIAARDGQLRCYVAVDRAAVLREADRLDAVPPHARGPLHGAALAVKDLIDVAGLPTRAGSSFFRRDPDVDAPVVRRLRDAGALVVGKTATHEFAWGVTTENPHFGRTANPLDPARIAGGSSGGSGAALAAGLADLALGTDTLGSIRIPAALCGLYGIRPATGTFPLDGIVPLALGLDTVGPMARDLAMVRRAYVVLAGADIPATAATRVCRLRGGGWDALAPATHAALDALVERLRARGVRVDTVDWWDDALARAVAVVQMHAAARFHAPLIAAHRDAYGADVRERVERALTVDDAALAAARATIDASLASWRAATAGYACALAPIARDEAPLAPAPPAFRDETIPLVTPASAFALPALAIPIGTGAHGLPLGAQIIGLDGMPGAAFALAERA